MQIACNVEHLTIHEVDRIGRPYVFQITRYFAANTGELVRTKGQLTPAFRQVSYPGNESRTITGAQQGERHV